jgi:hypothetical protein
MLNNEFQIVLNNSGSREILHIINILLFLFILNYPNVTYVSIVTFYYYLGEYIF